MITRYSGIIGKLPQLTGNLLNTVPQLNNITLQYSDTMQLPIPLQLYPERISLPASGQTTQHLIRDGANI